VLLGVLGAAVSLLFPAPVVAVASDGPWVGVAEGRSARDCDRVSVWDYRRPNAVRLGRATPCQPGSGVVAVSVARNRALWLHRSGGSKRTWTLWTATTKRVAPRLLARADAPGVIVIGPGNYDRRLFSNPGEGDVLPYAVGTNVVVLRADGSLSYRWTAPSPVTALASEPSLLLVGVHDGRVFLLQGGDLGRTYPGTVAVRRVFFTSDGVLAQRGSSLQRQGGECERTISLAAGERLLAASGGRMVIGQRTRIDVLPGCRGGPVATATGTAASLDNSRFTVASGRRVTTRLLPEP
jgi:hypothetical protein